MTDAPKSASRSYHDAFKAWWAENKHKTISARLENESIGRFAAEAFLAGTAAVSERGTPSTDAIEAGLRQEYGGTATTDALIEVMLIDRRELENALGDKQAKIDRLMLEYCPEEMTEAQTAEWAKHQRAAPLPELQQISAGTLAADDARLFGEKPVSTSDMEFWQNEAGRFEESNRQAQETIDDLRQQLADAVSTRPLFVVCSDKGVVQNIQYEGVIYVPETVPVSAKQERS